MTASTHVGLNSRCRYPASTRAAVPIDPPEVDATVAQSSDPRHQAAMPHDDEHPKHPIADRGPWIDSAIALKLVVKRLADQAEAESKLDEHARSGALTACCSVVVEDWDWCPVPPSPPEKNSPSVLSIRRALPGRVIMLGGAFWNSHASRFEARLWHWQTGIFLSVLEPVPVLTTNNKDGRVSVPAQKRLIGYGVRFRRDEITAFAAKLPAFSSRTVESPTTPKARLTKWSWDEAEARVKKAIAEGIVEGKRWPPRYGPLAVIERELARELVALDGDSPSESSIRRRAKKIIDKPAAASEPADPL